MRVLLTGGQAGDNPHLLPLLDAIAVDRIGPGRPRSRPEVVIADKRLLTSLDPARPARTADPVHQPRTRVPDRPPGRQRRPRRTTPNLRRRGLQTPQRRRTMLQPAQTIPRPDHPLRQTRRLLPSRTHHRRHHPLAPMTYRTEPRRRGLSQQQAAAIGHLLGIRKALGAQGIAANSVGRRHVGAPVDGCQYEPLADAGGGAGVGRNVPDAGWSEARARRGKFAIGELSRCWSTAGSTSGPDSRPGNSVQRDMSQGRLHPSSSSSQSQTLAVKPRCVPSSRKPGRVQC